MGWSRAITTFREVLHWLKVARFLESHSARSMDVSHAVKSVILNVSVAQTDPEKLMARGYLLIAFSVTGPQGFEGGPGWHITMLTVSTDRFLMNSN